MEIISEYQKLKEKLKSHISDSEIDKELEYFETLLVEKSNQSLHNENMFKLISENIVDVVWVLDITTQQFTYVSPSVERLRGYTAEEILKLPASDSLSPESAKKVEESIKKTLPKFLENPFAEEIHYHEIEQPCKDGSIVLTETSTRYRFNPQNNHIEVVGVSQDISERKKTESAFWESELRFKNMFKFHNAIMLLVEHETGKILDANKAAEKFYDYSKNQLCSMLMSEINTISLEEILQECEKAVTEKRNYFIFTHKLANNEERIVEVHSSPIDFNKKRILFSIIHDITIRHNSEIQLQKYANELNQLNKDKDKFFSILAHDLKNPFSALLGFSDLLLQNLRIYNIEKIESQVKIIHKTAHKTYELLEDLLLWAKSQLGKLSFEPRKVSFNEICFEVISHLKTNADVKHISIRFLESERTTLVVDVEMFKTILRNLISNSIKFTNENGFINIFVEKDSENAIISVSDSGIGISLEKQRKLFDITQ